MAEVLRALRGFGVYALLTAASVATLLPLALSILTAFKSPAEYAATSPVSLPQRWTLQNFVSLLDGPFARALLVTALSAVFLLATQVPFAVLAAFSFATGRFRGKEALFRLYVATLLVPTPVLVIPLYVIMVRAGLADTFWSLVVPFALASPFATFLLRQHFAALPDGMLDAARLDGASEAQALLHFALPLCRPAIATVALITIVTQWNSFLWPAVIGGSDWQTVTVATAGLQTQFNGHWTVVMAATTLTIVPVLAAFLALQRPLVHTLNLDRA